MSCQMNLPSKKMSGKSLISEMDVRVQRMLKLIEEDADSFAKRAEMYYQKRPELISLVEDFHRMYKTLAERYEITNGELRRNGASYDLNSPTCWVSEVGSEPPSTMPSPPRLFRVSTMPSPEMRLSRHRSGTPRAAGFDFFFGGGSISDLSSREGDDISTLDYESGSDDFSSFKNYFAMARPDDEQNTGEAQESLDGSEAEIVDPGGKYDDEVARLGRELRDKELHVKKLEEQLKSSQDEITILKNQLGKERQEVSKLQGRVSKHKTSLLERDQEVCRLKEAMSNADITLSQEKMRLRKETRKFWKEKMFLEDNVKGLELWQKSLEEELRQVKTGKAEKEAAYGKLVAETTAKDNYLTELITSIIAWQLEVDVAMAEKDDLNGFVKALTAEVSSKDDLIDRMNDHVQQLHVEHIDLIAVADRARKSADSLQWRVRELEKEVEKKQKIIVEGAEEKREAIRQLCFSLEHYRNGYHRLRQAVIGSKHKPAEAIS